MSDAAPVNIHKKASWALMLKLKVFLSDNASRQASWALMLKMNMFFLSAIMLAVVRTGYLRDKGQVGFTQKVTACLYTARKIPGAVTSC